MTPSLPTVVVVHRETRLQGLKERWGTGGQARFRISRAHAIEKQQRSARRGPQSAEMLKVANEATDFQEYFAEDQTYQDVLGYLRKELDLGVRLKFLDRSLVPTFDFWDAAAVVVVGQDGLVANAAKYVGKSPIVGVNPDPDRYDGVLLPYQPEQVRGVVSRVLEGRHRARSVTLAEVNLNDGQRMLAFNDFFIGGASHVSARYTIEAGGRCEPQSSSGVLVATGAGSTGWLSSIFNMASGIARFTGGEIHRAPAMRWEDRRLFWAVREPFVSKQSWASLVAGPLDEGDELVLESLMPKDGVIFSDGIEKDRLEFNAGTIAKISVSKQTAQLVVEGR